MAIEIPADWPNRTWVEDTPIGHLETVSVDAPPTVTRTNIIWNPSAEVNANGWESNSGFGAYDIATVARSTTRFVVGGASILVTAPTPVIGETWANFTNVPVALGGVYTYSAYVWSAVDATFFADVVFVAQGADTFVPAETWTRVSVTFSANSTQAFAGIGIVGAPAGFQYYVDGAMLEMSSSLNPYFDGSFPDSSEVIYSWVGSAHASNSTSVATVPEEPRLWQVASWSTTREIASSALPGQVRHKTGLSIGTGQALVRRNQEDHPWNRRDVFNLSGLHAQILLAPERRTKIPTGQFRVAPIKGNMTTLGVEVDLDERQIEGATKSANVIGAMWVPPLTAEDAENRAFDPAWLIQKLAGQMGYGVGVSPGSTLPDGQTYAPVLDVPLQGALTPAWPTDIDFSSGPAGDATVSWGTLDDVIALTTRPDETSEVVTYLLGRTVVTSVTITADVYGWLDFEWDASSGPGRVHVGVQNRTGDTGEQTLEIVQFSTGSNGSSNTTTFSSHAAGAFDPDRPYGVQIQFELIGSPVTSTRTRVRRRGDAAWSAWFSHSMTNTLTIADVNFDVELEVRDGDNAANPYLSRVTIADNSTGTPNTPALLWGNTSGENGRLFLEPLVGTSVSTWLSPDLTVWGAMQEVVNAWQGALVTDVYGNLRLMNRFTLSGVGTGVERNIDAGLTFEDIPWVVDYTDQADRLEVKYRPVVSRQWEGSPALVDILWETPDRIAVPGGGSRDVFFTLDYIDPIGLESIPFIRKDVDNGAYHVWDAYRYSNGTGTHITPGDMIAMRLDRVSSSTWKIHIKNLTSDPWFYMVDNTATPYLKIRSPWYYDQTAEQVVERGLPAGESTSALEIDLSNYVQTEEDANALADFIWSRVNRRQWKAETITMVPDYRLDLGDVVSIRHERTNLRANALVTKVILAGEPGSVTQQVDLVLIPPTWEDFDEAWGPEYHTSPPGSWAEFDALWDIHTWAEFDLAPTATTEQEIQEFL